MRGQLNKHREQVMRSLNSKQIAQVKTLATYSQTHFHANRKKVGSLLVSEIKEIVAKKQAREWAKFENSTRRTNFQILRQLINQSLRFKGTPYLKTLIEGSTGIYYASPLYGHKDYNKSRVFDKTPDTLRLMQIFNAIVNK